MGSVKLKYFRTLIGLIHHSWFSHVIMQIIYVALQRQSSEDTFGVCVKIRFESWIVGSYDYCYYKFGIVALYLTYYESDESKKT